MAVVPAAMPDAVPTNPTEPTDPTNLQQSQAAELGGGEQPRLLRSGEAIYAAAGDDGQAR